MGFFQNLFKGKPGGSIVGNLLRGVVNKASGGSLGTGAKLVTKYGSTSVNPITIPTSAEQIQQAANTYLQPAASSLATNTLKDTFKKYWYYLLIPFGLIFFLLLNKKPNRYGYRR